MCTLSMFGLLLATNLSLTYVAWFGPTPQDLSEPSLHQVQRIYVGNMGDADEAGRFRLLIEEQVAKRICSGRFTGEGRCNHLCVSVVSYCCELVNHRDTENTQIAQRNQ